MLERITPVVLTYNEEPNIGRMLQHLSWALRVIVCDSYSSDETPVIARSFPNVSFVQREFTTHSEQWNHAIGLVETDWILAMDADYWMSNALRNEIASLHPAPSIAGFIASFRYSVFGHVLRASLYPPATVLFRRGAGHYIQDGHTQRLAITGELGQLRVPMIHDDRKRLDRWLQNQANYMKLEADRIRRSRFSQLSWRSRLRKARVIAPPVVLFYTLFIQGTLLDGWPGLYYALQRTVAEIILSLRLIEMDLPPNATDSVS